MRYHFILTLQWSTAAANETQHGTATLQPGTTRANCLAALIEKMRRGRDGDPVVLFFALEPDEIRAA